jgi:hypothetical protein
VEEMRDLAEATVEEEVAMEVEVEEEDMAVGAEVAVATEGEEADTAGRVAEEASNAIGALYL